MSRSASPEPAATAGGPCWFIYYRVQLDDLAQAVVVARVGQRRLCQAHPGLTAELMQRPSSSGPTPQMTLLETYRAPADWPAGQARALPAAIERVQAAALARWLQGPRHLEMFEPCA
ncbi:DUF4936 family protein [Ideonella sp.]|uniref:DUF4936 family protein n=1 Tax=Ideonella sp. TaxID=1929293 RepID=UPI002B478B2F|nr:DUF4936 family protein [Ideonella sp.]HJV69097.1 DUF4936 family protein [Ideonella sp.]